MTDRRVEAFRQLLLTTFQNQPAPPDVRLLGAPDDPTRRMGARVIIQGIAHTIEALRVRLDGNRLVEDVDEPATPGRLPCGPFLHRARPMSIRLADADFVLHLLPECRG